MISSAFATPVPAHSDELKVSFPAEHVLLLSFNRPKSLNTMTPQMERDLDALMSWFSDEPSLWYAPPPPPCPHQH